MILTPALTYWTYGPVNVTSTFCCIGNKTSGCFGYYNKEKRFYISFTHSWVNFLITKINMVLVMVITLKIHELYYKNCPDFGNCFLQMIDGFDFFKEKLEISYYLLPFTITFIFLMFFFHNSLQFFDLCCPDLFCSNFCAKYILPHTRRTYIDILETLEIKTQCNECKGEGFVEDLRHDNQMYVKSRSKEKLEV